MATRNAPAILRLPEVKARTGKGTTSIYGDMKLGLFPRSIPIGSRSVGWLESDIEAWIEARVAEGRAQLEAA